MIEFLNMGGYALFVWSAYSIALILVITLYIKSTRELSKLTLVAEKKKLVIQEKAHSLPQQI
jgi:heme exporter protein CcmD